MSGGRNIVAVALLLVFLMQSHASVTPKTADNPCGVRGTWDAANKECNCKEGWDPKYNCDFGLNPLGDVPWQQQFTHLADPTRYKVSLVVLHVLFVEQGFCGCSRVIAVPAKAYAGCALVISR